MRLSIKHLQQQMLAHITGIPEAKFMQAELMHAELMHADSGKKASENIHANHLLRPNTYLNPTQALAIYQRAFTARLLDCLRADFPILRQHLGDQLFHHFATEYLKAFPPNSYSLYDLGEHFADYLQQTCPDLSSLTGVDQMMYLLPIETARAERMRVSALRAKGTEGLTLAEPDYHHLQQLKRISMTSPEVCSVMSAQASLLHLLNLNTGEENSDDCRRIYLAISRCNYRVTTDSIEQWQYDFLRILKETHPSSILLEDLIAQLANRFRYDVEIVYARLALWLPVAISRAYIVVELNNGEHTD